MDNQVKEMLEVIGTGLKSVREARKKDLEHQKQTATEDETHRVEEHARWEDIMKGAWHDGRIDCIAGNGVMSELGYGDEPMLPSDWDALPPTVEKQFEASQDAEAKQRQRQATNKAISALPIVIIKNFAARRGKDEIMTVLTQWAATLVESQVRLGYYSPLYTSDRAD